MHSESWSTRTSRFRDFIASLMHVLLFVLVVLMLIAVPWRGWHDFKLYPAGAIGAMVFVLLLYMLYHA